MTALEGWAGRRRRGGLHPGPPLRPGRASCGADPPGAQLRDDRVRVLDRHKQLAQPDRDPAGARTNGRIDLKGDERPEGTVYEPAATPAVNADAHDRVARATHGANRTPRHVGVKAPAHADADTIRIKLEVRPAGRPADHDEQRLPPAEADRYACAVHRRIVPRHGDFGTSNPGHHGMPEQRKEARNSGFQTGDASSCNKYLDPANLG